MPPDPESEDLHRAGAPSLTLVVPPHSDLDDLSPEELDSYPLGLVLLDGSGRVHAYNAAETRMSGRSADSVIGRNFFRDVAPCTHLPAFHGRFLAGVRRGSLDETFQFTFGFEPQPVRVEVRLWPARQADRYWLATRVIEAFAPSRQRSAAQAVAAVEQRTRAEPVDPSVCEREPIHIPGAVQPHAVMLACDPAELTVRACSDNIPDAFPGMEVPAAMGRPLSSFLPSDLVDTLRAGLGGGLFADPARPLRRALMLGSPAAPFGLTAHLHEGRLIVELERLADHPADFSSATPLQAQDAVTRIRSAGTLVEAAEAAVGEIRDMTGFERVLVYRFDPEWNGEAIAEDKTETWDQSLLWLKFPASDIPAQARALYTRSASRFVVDRDAVPAAVLAQPQSANEAVDLTFAQARALSPIHLEYQRNLGVNGSMSLSIMVDGRLWGLVIGHHRKPHYVTPETRALASLVTDAFALRVHELDSVRVWREQQWSQAVQNRLLERMAGSEDFVAALTDGASGVTILDAFKAGGAAVVSGDTVAIVGSTPPDPVIRDLAGWLRSTLPPSEQSFMTDRLVGHYAPASEHRETASGLLAAFVEAGGREHLLLWFRPEVATTIVWGGNPNKPVLADSSTRTVLPRRSFERWVEERRDQSDPWADWQRGTAEALVAAIEGVVLRQGRRIAELTATHESLTRALEQKDLLAREIDHRVKNSLQIVAGVMLMQARGVSDPQARAAFEDTYARVMSVARVHESLHHSEDVESVDLGQTLRRLCDDLSAGMTGAEQRLDVEAEPGLIVSSRAAVALSMIATELVTNALKYAYDPGEPGPVEVSLKAGAQGGFELTVCDSGRGLPENWTETSPRARGGLGMRVIRAMLQQLGAEMKVVYDRGPGACFTVVA